VVNKFLGALVLLLSLATNGNAQNLCPTIAKYTEATMKARQHNVGLSQLLDSIETVTNEGVRARMKSITLRAFEEPHFATEEMQNRAIQDFTDNIRLACEREYESN